MTSLLLALAFAAVAGIFYTTQLIGVINDLGIAIIDGKAAAGFRNPSFIARGRSRR